MADQYATRAPSRRALTEGSHAGQQPSGGQTASSLLGEHRIWARAAGSSSTELLSRSDCLMNCPSPLEGYFSLKSQYRSSEVRSHSLQAALEQVFQRQSPVFLSQYSLSVTLSFKNHCHYVISQITTCSTLVTFVIAASQNKSKESHPPITVTYDLLLQAIMFSFWWLQFPRMAFLDLVLRGRQLEGNGKKPGTRRPGETISLKMFCKCCKWRKKCFACLSYYQ